MNQMTSKPKELDGLGKQLVRTQSLTVLLLPYYTHQYSSLLRRPLGTRDEAAANAIIFLTHVPQTKRGRAYIWPTHA